MADLTQFDLGSAARIARVVRHVEQDVRTRPLTFDSVQQSNAKQVLLCVTQSNWGRNTVATLNVWQGGTPPNETQTVGRTVEAVNKMHFVLGGMFVLVARAGNGVWYLAESSMPPVLTGTFTAPWNKNTSKNVVVSVLGASYTLEAVNRFASAEGSGSKNCAIAYNGTQFVLIAAEC